MLRIVSHYNFFPIFTTYICPWTLHPTQATLSVEHFLVFDYMQIAPDSHPVEDLLVFPPEATAPASCLQLMMQPQGKWVQRFDKTNTGVTVVASRVSRKLSVSKGRLWNPTTCWTTMWICKVIELQTYSSISLSTSPGLSPNKHAASTPWSSPLGCLRARALLLGWHRGLSRGSGGR